VIFETEELAYERGRSCLALKAKLKPATGNKHRSRRSQVLGGGGGGVHIQRDTQSKAIS
jgi:hypothetical protein